MKEELDATLITEVIVGKENKTFQQICFLAEMSFKSKEDLNLFKAIRINGKWFEELSQHISARLEELWNSK